MLSQGPLLCLSPSRGSSAPIFSEWLRENKNSGFKEPQQPSGKFMSSNHREGSVTVEEITGQVTGQVKSQAPGLSQDTWLLGL